MIAWSDVVTNESIKDTLFDSSGLAFMLQPWLDLEKYDFDAMQFYLGFANGLLYLTPDYFREGKVDTIDVDTPANESCFPPLTLLEIIDPPPFGGYDCRCRPWYQHAIINKNEKNIEMRDSYLDYST